MYCRGCGYDVRGLAEHTCSECGRRFDPQDRRTYLLRRNENSIRAARNAAKLIPLAVVGIVVVALVTLFALAALVVNQL